MDLASQSKAPFILRLLSRVISFCFHPLFIPLYVTFFLAYVHPTAFTGFSMMQKKQAMLIVGLNVVAFPLFTVLLLKAVGFISSLYMHTAKDRIIPYIACGIFFFWAYTVFRQQNGYPDLLTTFLLGIFLASSAGLIANIYLKISMHALGMGGLVGFMLIIFRTGSMLMAWPLALSILLTGFVCTSRLLISDHSQKEIYSGLLAGLLTQVVAAIYIL